jgi:RNA polymerase sigma-70 factor, ECF subfamily
VLDTDQLVTGLRRHEPGALEELYDRFGGAVYALAMRMTRDAATAEEISLDAFMQVWEQAERFNADHGSLQSWLFTIVRSRTIDRLRAVHAAKRTHVEDATPAHEPARPEEAAEASQRRQLVRRAMAELSHAQRTALELAYYEGLSHAQIAERLGEPLGTVKGRIRQAMITLRRLLAPAVLTSR